MKKRLVSFLLATSLVILSVSPVFASDQSNDTSQHLWNQFTVPSDNADADYVEDAFGVMVPKTWIEMKEQYTNTTQSTSNPNASDRNPDGSTKSSSLSNNGYPSSTEGYTKSDNLSDNGYPSSTDGYASKSDPNASDRNPDGSTKSSATSEDAKGAADYEQEKLDAKKAMSDVFKKLMPGASDVKINAAVQSMSDVVTSLRSFGLSNPAIAGICANIWCESKFFPYAIQNESGSVNADLVYVPIATNLVLKCGDASPLDDKGGYKSEKDFMERSTRTYTVSLSSTPGDIYSTKYDEGSKGCTGIGLIQFTDYKSSVANLANGLRGSQLNALGEACASSVTTCIYRIPTGSIVVAKNSSGNWNSSEKIDAKSVNYLYIPDSVTQMGLLCCTLNEEGKAGEGSLGFSGFQPKDGYSQTWDEYKNSSDPNFAVIDFMMTVERPSESAANSRVTDNQEAIEEIIKLVMNTDINFEATTSIANMGEAEAVNYMTSLAKSGFYTEEQLSSFASLAESNIDRKLLSNAIRSNLDNQELEELANWERNVSSNSFESIIMGLARKTLMLFGILLEIWSLLVYLAYWFDRLNNIIPISLLSILTFGKLRIADDVTEATYSIKDNSHKTSIKTVNHRAVLFIVVLGLSLGTLIVTGYIYVIIHWLVLKVHNLLK